MFRRRPPRLSPPKRAPLSPFRRALRLVVWMTLGMVVTLRWLLPHDPGAMRMFQGQGWQGPRQGWQANGRRYRSSKRLQDPVGEVPTNLWRIRIDVSEQDMAKLRRTTFEWRRGPAEKRPEVRVTVVEGGETYPDVALHLKGSAGSFRQVDDTPAMTLNFSKHVKGRSFHGYPKISLNNSLQDPSYVAEALARELFASAGVPAPKTDHATVILNGRDLGLYVFAEGWSKTFLKRELPETDGILYDGGFVQDIDADLAINVGPDGAGRAGLDRALAAAKVADPEERWSRLGEALDVERFASLLAMEVMTCHWDGYGLNRNNYRVLDDRLSHRLVFLPHGMDQMFGRGQRMRPESSIEPPMQGVVARAFLQTTEGRRLYLERIARFRADFFTEQRLTNRVQELAERIRPTLLAYGPEFAREHDGAVRELCRGISRRVRSIDAQLAHPREPAEFDATGVLRLSGWEARQGPQSRPGPSTFSRDSIDGRQVLQIHAGTAGGSGSWRTRLYLGPGHYRLEGQALTTGVAGSGGVCLRISGGARRYPAGADGTWNACVHRFKIGDPLVEVELVCDFEAERGNAAFDEASLRLVREK